MLPLASRITAGQWMLLAQPCAALPELVHILGFHSPTFAIDACLRWLTVRVPDRRNAVLKCSMEGK